jgi:FKBP-type peptidyl-prolyl cis-trans isomerase
MKIIDETIGTGNAVKSGDTVRVHYRGTLENGTKFDSSYDRGQPFGFILGRGMVIQGWDEGLLGAKRGDKKHLVIPGQKAYGDQEIKDATGKVIVPKNATLIFDLEVVEVVAKAKVDAMIKEQQDTQVEEGIVPGAK